MKDYKKEFEKFGLFEEDYPVYEGAEEFAISLKKEQQQNDENCQISYSIGTGSNKIGCN